MKICQRSALAALMAGIGLLGACASLPVESPGPSAPQVNIMAHVRAGGTQPVSTERMTLAIRRYKENKSIPPVKMRTTDSVDEE